jgi:hypothetical protein
MADSHHPEGFVSFPARSEWFTPGNTRSKSSPGIKRIKRSMTRKVILNPTSNVHMQCMQDQVGKFYYIPLDPYKESNFRIIDEVSPLLVNPTPSQFEPGAMYTFVIASIIQKERGTNRDIELVPMKLYASKSMNMFEFGTKHHQIFYRMAKQLNELRTNRMQYGLYASGEIHCIDHHTLVFNFFSGTYKMKRHMHAREEYEVASIRKLMHEIDPAYRIEFDFRPFIVPEVMPITQHEIKRLESNGIPVFKFDSKEQCRDMRIATIRHKNFHPTKEDMTLEQMKEAHQKIIAPIASQSSGPRPGMPGYIPPKPSTSAASAAPASAAFGIVPSAGYGYGGNKKTLKKRKSMKRKSMKQKHRK